MLRDIYGDDERFEQTSTGAESRAMYFTGDGAQARRGRLLLDHGPHRRCASTSPAIASARWKSKARWSITRRWPKPPSSAGPTKSKAKPSVAFVTLKAGSRSSNALKEELKSHVVKKIGAFARPDEIRFTADAAQNPQRQNHAPVAARHRRWARVGRYDDFG